MTATRAGAGARTALHDPGAIVTRNALRLPARTAYVQGDRELTWAQVQDGTCALAAGLGAAGVGRGDHVALLAGNDLEWVIAQFAVWKLGAVPVFLHGMLPDGPLAGQLAQSRCTALLAGPAFARRVPALRALAPIPRRHGEARHRRVSSPWRSSSSTTAAPATPIPASRPTTSR